MLKIQQPPKFYQEIISLINSDLGEAEAVTRLYLAADENNFYLLSAIATIFFEQKKFSECSNIFESILLHYGDSYPNIKLSIYSSLGQSRLNEKNYSAAIEVYTMLNKLKPNDCNIIGPLAYCHVHRKSYDVAKQYIQTAFELDEHNANTLFVSGYLKECTRNLEGAVSDYNSALLTNPLHQSARQNRDGLFEKLTRINAWMLSNEEASIVMVGNSHFDFANWEEMFPGKGIVTQGVGGACTIDILERVDGILKTKANKVFLQIGLGDFTALNHSVEVVFYRYKQIVELLGFSINQVFILSTIKVNSDIMGEDYLRINHLIDSLNIQLSTLGARSGIKYIDINFNLCTDGCLKEDLSYDGVHLNEQGYKVLKNSLHKYV